ncbi:hydrogenase expression/formation protein HypE [Halovenus sp. WSH3]|uniref:Hydrogenase expression/formation protein HypE n=1 Tax=Halovenus carboxidivorans TaxID=2692199 RepID=A0A6B0T3P4_9EURY|nr:hydrogenase expression/formation protein HypE [Halovenus carboxidivorans]MXR52665.1 hydrogenase expression/formation protein HypE [Halovenus carboxidivorans]
MSADDEAETLTAAHGAGRAEMRSFLSETVLERLGDPIADGVGLPALDDGAVLPDGDRSLVVTTDSHVVDPPVFPGGDLGRLGVAGTVNDLAAMGAVEPLTLTCGLVVEAGTPTDRIETILDSMAETAEECGVSVQTGDTKVLPPDDLDGIVLNTTGIGRIPRGEQLTSDGLSPGDRLLVTGPVGQHGIALLAAREGFDFETDLRSDVAPVNHLVAAAREAGTVTAATDPTRGGLATALTELAARSGVGLVAEDRAVPVSGATDSAAAVLGLDPKTVACEGRMVLGVAPEDAESVLDAVRATPGGEQAALIGDAVDDHTGRVVVDTGIGQRYLTEPSGQQLPRIC